MATPPPFQSFRPQDYPDAPEWFTAFLDNLNTLVKPVFDALAGGIGRQNCEYKLRTLEFTSGGAGTYGKLSFLNDLGRKVEQLQVVQAIPADLQTPNASAPAILGWRNGPSGTLEIDGILGLNASTSYLLKVRYE